MAAKIGVGILGLSAGGGWAGLAHVPALHALSDDFEIRGLTASSTQSARAAAEKFSIPFCSVDPDALASRPDIDLIVVTVRVPEHRKLVKAALDAGKMVYCEWPLGNGLDEAVFLADLARRKQVRAVVGLQARAAPAVCYVYDLVKQGYVGEVLSTTMTAFSGGIWGGSLVSRYRYLLDESNGATMLTIPLSHSIDAMAWILGEFQSLSALTATRRTTAVISETGEVVPVTAPDQVAITGTLARGVVASVHYRGGDSRTPGFTWEINGTEGDIVVKGNSGHLQYGLVDIYGAAKDQKKVAPLEVPARYSRLHLTEKMAVAVGHGYLNLLDDIRTGSNKVPTFDDAVVRHRMIDAIQRSARSGRHETYQ